MIGERRVLSTIIHLGSIVDDSKNYPIDFAPSKIEGRRKEKIRKKREREKFISVRGNSIVKILNFLREGCSS